MPSAAAAGRLLLRLGDAATTVLGRAKDDNEREEVEEEERSKESGDGCDETRRAALLPLLASMAVPGERKPSMPDRLPVAAAGRTPAEVAAATAVVDKE